MIVSRLALPLIFGLAAAGTALSAEHEVRMLNKGAAGTMVFEPALVHAEIGDTVRFVPTDKGHNAETVGGMLPDGANPFKGAMNREVAVTLVEEGVYGVKCAPHYGMGMVALIIVGRPGNIEAASSVKHPGKAKAVFADLLGRTRTAQ